MKIHRKLSLLSWRLAMFGEIQSSSEIGLIWGLKLEWNPISVLDNAPCRCNQRNIKLFKCQSTIYIYICNLHRKGSPPKVEIRKALRTRPRSLDRSARWFKLQTIQTNKWFLSKICLTDLWRRCPVWRCFSCGSFVAVPLWRLKMTKIKTLRATDGWTGGRDHSKRSSRT